MMQKLEKLIDSLTLLADMAAVALRQRSDAGVHEEGFSAASAAAFAAAPAPKAPKSHKAKAPVATMPEEAPRTAAPEQSVEDQLGLGVEEQKAPEAPVKPELNDKDLQARVEEVTKQYTALCKNDTPAEGGKNPGLVRAIALLTGTFKAKSLPVMTRGQKVEWIATMEKWISEHK